MILKFLLAFLVGGILCAIVQVLIDKTSLTPAKILVSFVVLGVGLGSFNLYEPLLKFCGCGISVPLIGFGASVAGGVREAVDSTGLIGAVGGAFKSAGIGLGASLFFGFLFSLFFKGKSKRL